MRRAIFIKILIFIITASHAQVETSIATDASVMRNLSPQQKFWAFGQTIQGNFHFSPKEAAYAWIAYYSLGKFRNDFTANQKTININPAQIVYTVRGTWLPRQLSMGWKHYFIGSYNNEGPWNLYGLAGFGLLSARVTNVFTLQVDTSKYFVPPIPVEGNGRFRQLTFDLGLGFEFPLGGTIYFYSDVRVWRAASEITSPYFHNTNNIPAPVMINAGLRILFDTADY